MKCILCGKEMENVNSRPASPVILHLSGRLPSPSVVLMLTLVCCSSKDISVDFPQLFSAYLTQHVFAENLYCVRYYGGYKNN